MKKASFLLLIKLSLIYVCIVLPTDIYAQPMSINQNGEVIFNTSNYTNPATIIFTGAEVDPIIKPSANIHGMLGDYNAYWWGAYIYSIRYYSMTQVSDERLKENIVPYKNSLDKINQLDVIQYNLKESLFKDVKSGRKEKIQKKGKNNIGFSAQNLKQHFPNLVEEDGDSVMRVNYIGVIPILVAAMQEQQTTIDALKKEINALKELKK